MRKILSLILLSIALISPLFAQEEDLLKAQLISETTSVEPGKPFWVALRIEINEGWHSYWKNPGDSGMAASIQWNLPAGFTPGQTEWPYPISFEVNGLTGYGFEGETWLLTQITPSADVKPGTNVDLSANVRWLVCSETTCVPGQSTATTTLPIKSQSAAIDSTHSASFTTARSKLPQNDWTVEAVRSGDLLELRISKEGFTVSHVDEAQFFPEHKRTIDTKTPVVITKKGNQLSLALKECTSTNRKVMDTLEGVLLIKDPAGNPHPVAINTPWPAADDDVIAMADKKLAVEAAEQPLNMEFEGGVALAIVFAFLGGMILNLMPCVLPVISFKVLSFVKMAGESRSETMKHGIAFSVGVIVSFWVLAIIMLVLQAYGQSVGWGFQLQEPLFVAVLAAFLFIFALSLFGVFELGTSITSLAGQAQSQKSGLISSFLSGILATAVATPCTGPFLGSAIGFAVTLPAWKSLIIFTSLGLGMAFPYLILAAYPKLMRFLPKPGNWMIAFKELMGFMMVAAVLWLVWVFGAQTNSLGVVVLLNSFFFIALACWIFGKWGTPVQPLKIRMTSYILAGLCFFGAGTALLNVTAPWVMAYTPLTSGQSDQSEWLDFSEEKIAELRAQGIPVFVDFTAKWCLICQANHFVLTTNEVNREFDRLGVVRMKADWTKSDERITKALRRFGRNGVPLYVLYEGNTTSQPKILPQVLTPDVVISYLNELDQVVADAQ